MTILWRVRNDRKAEFHMEFPTETEAVQWAEEHNWICFYNGLEWRIFMKLC